ncbi:hypothetical protein GCM10010211_30800 [Streptomyces albospinus]|uniref:DUF6292 domain-containing protein n=1 Tax=Streptomyces albospinus TaxID=285515 RepID=A0ABQ2V1C8_9ACTN|nr:DUF6292 family protein [Streptomyces albospinus]GGU63604.1 hypothetical protein GCM10010211_30800 [Streptomyces albospinus]
MTELDYCEAHAPYLQAVADALAAADIRVNDWSADADEARSGFIILSHRDTAAVYDEDEVTLLWNEEMGWLAGWGEPDAARVEWLAELYNGVLPTPAEMVTATRELLTTQPNITLGRPGYYRSLADEDDFETQLAQYARRAADQ